MVAFLLGRRLRRLRALLLAAVLAVVAVPLLPFVAPASALGLGVCPPGTVGAREVMGAGSLLTVLNCYTEAGDYLGYVNPTSGSFTLGTTATEAVQLSETSSALAATTTGASTAEAEGLVALDAAAADGSMVAYGGPQVAGLAIAGYGGYQIGNLGINYACHHSFVGTAINKLTGGVTSGAGKFYCHPPKNATYVANSDITVTNDPGFVPTNSVTTTLNCYNDSNAIMNCSPTTGSVSLNAASPFFTSCCGGSYLFNLAGTPTSAAPSTGHGTGNVAVAACRGPHVAADFGNGSSLPSDCVSGGQFPEQFGRACTDCAGSAGTWTAGNNYYGTVPPHAYQSRVSTTGYVDLFIFGGNGVPSAANYQTAYYAPGSAQRPAAVPANPSRVIRATNVCSDGSRTTADSDPYTDLDAQLPGIPAPPSCPSGTTVTEYIVQTIVVATGKATPWIDKTVPAGVKTWQQNYPGCGTGVCKLGLYQVQPDGSLKDCFKPTGSAGTWCAGWFADANKTSDYVCTYGTADSSADPHVALSECNAYAPSFDPAKQAAGVSYGDPATGKSTDSKPAQSDPTDEGTGTQPVTQSPDTAGLPGQGGATCWPNGFPSSPLDVVGYIFLPIKCALVWAFVPDPSVVSSTLQSTWNTVSSRPPLSILVPLTSIVANFAGQGISGSCSDPIANFGNSLTVPCTPPTAVNTYLTPIYVLCQIAIGIGAAFGVWKLVEDGLSQK